MLPPFGLKVKASYTKVVTLLCSCRKSRSHLDMGASICRWMQAGSKRTSLVVQWLRIHLPMQGTQVRSLVSKLGSNILQSD